MNPLGQAKSETGVLNQSTFRLALLRLFKYYDDNLHYFALNPATRKCQRLRIVIVVLKQIHAQCGKNT